MSRPSALFIALLLAVPVPGAVSAAPARDGAVPAEASVDRASLPADSIVGDEPTGEAVVSDIPVEGVDEEALEDPTALEEPAHDEESHEAHSPAPAPGLRFTEEHGAAEEGPESGSAADPGELAVLSAPELTGDFMVAGVTWDLDTPEVVTEVALRVREGDSWGDWTELALHDVEEDGGRAGTEPLIALDADAIQARVATESGNAPADLRIDLVDPAQDGEAAVAPAMLLTEPNGHEIRPTVRTRAQWGADEKSTRAVSQSSGLKAMYVHHTAGANGYSSSQSAAIVRGIHSYHVKSNGWPDIGYQFLVDRFGTVFEGRRGSIEGLPVGAQAGGYNTDTIGVSAIGSFQSTQPPAAMVSSITRVLAWKAYQHDLDPTAHTTLTTGSSTGSGTRAGPGEKVRVPVILGHRDTNLTACPGGHLHSRLPAIRTAVGKAVDSAVRRYGEAGTAQVRGSLTGPSTIPAGGQSGVAVQYTKKGSPVPSATVTLQKLRNGIWKDAATIAVRDGKGSRYLRPGSSGATYRLRNYNASAVSAPFTIRVSPSEVTAQLTGPSTIPPGGKSSVRVTYSKGGKPVPSATVKVQKLIDGRWRHGADITIKNGVGSRYLRPGSKSATYRISNWNGSAISSTFGLEVSSNVVTYELTGPTAIEPGGKSSVEVTYTKQGAPVPSATVKVQKLISGQWRNAADITIKNGVGSRYLRPGSKSATYRISNWNGSGISDTFTLTVGQNVVGATLTGPSTVGPWGTSGVEVTYSKQGTPVPSATVTLQKLRSGVWKDAATITVKDGVGSRYLRPGSSGATYRVRNYNGSAISAPFTITVRS